MNTLSRHRYLPYLLAATVLMTLAAAIFPWDVSIASAVRAFSDRGGARHCLHELLSFMRPFGKGEIVLLLAACMGVCGNRRRALHIILAVILAGLLVWPFKLAVGRERPFGENTESFPSGDAATIAAFCTPLAGLSPWAAAGGALATATVAAGRVYYGNHFPSDVLTGAAIGVLSAAIAAAILRRRRLRIRRAWFLPTAIGLLAFDLVKIPLLDSLPNAFACLTVWGPLLLFLMGTRLWPAWRRLRQRHRHPAPRRPFLLALTATAVFALYLLVTGASTLWDRDEPRFARATVEMVQSGNFLYPTFNGQLRPDKPILIYWLMSLPVRLFGPAESACRLVAPVAAAGTGLLTAWAATVLVSPAAAIPAFLLLAMSPLMIASGTAATTDALLLFCMTATLCAFLLSWRRGFQPWHAGLMALSLAGALLTKGPVGLLPVLVILIALGVSGGGALRRAPYLAWLAGAVLAAVAVFLAWGIPANVATDGQFGAKGIGHHVVKRAMTPLESHGGKSLLFCLTYLPVIAVTFFPATLYLPMAFARRQTPPSPRDGTPAPASAWRLLLCWALPVIGVMSLVATKLPHYILPAWPALAMGAAIGMTRARDEGLAPRRLRPAARTGLTLFLVVGLTLGSTLAIAPWFLPVHGLRAPATGVGLLFLAMTVTAARQFRRGRHDAVLASLAAAMALILISAALWLLPAMESFKISPRLAARISAQSAASVPVSTCGYGEPSLNFYLNRGVIEPIDRTELPAWSKRPGPGILVIAKTDYRKAGRLFRNKRFHRLDQVSGYNYSQGKWTTLVVLERKPANQ